MIYNISKYALQILLTAGLVVCCFQSSISSNVNSGKTKKKTTVKSSLSFNRKSLNISLQNGFKFKGTFASFKEEPDQYMIRMNTAYFQKGNSIYVLPLKQKAVLSRFKTPEKTIY